LSEAVKWIEAQNQGAPVRLLAEAKDSWGLQGNALATGVNPPPRMVEWLKWVEQIQRNEIFVARVNHPALRLLGAKYLITDRKMEPTTRPAVAMAPAPTRRLFGRGE